MRFARSLTAFDFPIGRIGTEPGAKESTGYPLVDAAMRQINGTGYMHNRLRMVTASFLMKDLGVDWRWASAISRII